MTLKGDAKFEDKLTCGLENDMRNMANFHQSTWKYQNWNSDVIVENVWAENLQRSYVSWQWRMMQNFKRNWLVVSKLTRVIWWILTWVLESLKKCHFNELLLSKVYIVWAKKVERVIFHVSEEGYKIWRGIDLSFQKCHKKFDKFWPEHSKV